MGRKRKSTDDNRLPKHVYHAKGRYVYRPYRDGKLQGETVLCKDNAPLSQVWTAWEALQNGTQRRTLRWLFDAYLASADFARLAPKTQRDYKGASTRICDVKLRNGVLFGTIDIASITPGVLRRYADKRAVEAPIAANRDLAVISVAFGWAVERDYAKANPAKSVKRQPEKPRARYVSDSEYRIVHAAAGKYPYLQPIMELAYLCRMRLAEVLDLTRANLSTEGVLVVRRKGSKNTLTLWSPRLRAAVDAALALPRPFVALVDHQHYLIPGATGGRMNESTVQTAWQRIMPVALSAGLKERFTVHDLKAKGISDTEEGERRAGAGHMDPRITERVYNRLPGKAKPSGEA